jgi:putative restriction endonuclease
MKIWVGVTDDDWFNFLSSRSPDEVNFWQPTASRAFRVLSPGEFFLFKLHSPKNFIVGGGFFVRYTSLPCSLAWETFGEKNGVPDLGELVARIRRLRHRPDRGHRELDPEIGCNILGNPFFFPQRTWIPAPSDWAPNIVQGKTYDVGESIGHQLWVDVRERLLALGVPEVDSTVEAPRYGSEYLARARLGQGSFRVLVTDAYNRRCAITGERTLPVLEAAHIKPFAQSGPNVVSNGLLLRSDLHKLFDIGYLTITPDLHIEVSKKIKEVYENGHEYYAHHGCTLIVMPDDSRDRPCKDFLQWHNQNVFMS